MLSRLRASFAAKLLLAGLTLSLLVVGGISAYLLISRNSQTSVGALSNSDNRAAVMREVLQQITGEQAYATAKELATQPALVDALSGADPASGVPALFLNAPPVSPSGSVLLITGSAGQTVYARAATDLAGVRISDFEHSTGILDALAGDTCKLSAGKGACGLELIGTEPVYTVGVPVVSSRGRTVGAVVYIAPLTNQLQRFNTLFQFPTAFISASNPGVEVRNRSGVDVSSPTPPQLLAALRAHQDTVDGIYTAPDEQNGGVASQVAGSFVAVTGPDGKSIAGYIGVEVQLARFLGDERTDELTLGVITIFVLLVTAILVILFVETFVRRPIRRLERGVTRIAGGDYTSGVEVRGKDELARLGASVNRMRDNIRDYTTEIRAARERLDNAVERVSGVSRALTTTTGGVVALQREVVRTAAAIAGEGSAAGLALREGDQMAVRAAHPHRAVFGSFPDWESIPDVLAGRRVRRTVTGRGSLLVMPMFYQDGVVGALAVMSPSDVKPPAEDEEQVLAVLANNAAIAMENARLYEQERETVRRLRQLDSMKTDFLSTVQHELRTPLTAILGLSDLIDMCWNMWDDSPKLEAVRDIQVAAKNLYDIVETIIDFSAVDGESLGLAPTELSLADAVRMAFEGVGERYKGGLPIPAEADIDPGINIHADADRFGQVMRALIDNAVKFSDGRGRVLVRAERAEPGVVLIEVVDQGIGIPEDDLPRIFDRFYQVDNTATRRYGGTGMGLALVKRLVQAHGAKVLVETTLGVGTRVMLRWPESSEGYVGEAPEPPELTPPLQVVETAPLAEDLPVPPPLAPPVPVQ